jgi:hypothetical protein
VAQAAAECGLPLLLIVPRCPAAAGMTAKERDARCDLWQPILRLYPPRLLLPKMKDEPDGIFG